MTRIATIVEGAGEVHAFPVLLRRLAAERGVFDLTLPQPIRVARDRFLRREAEFQRMLLLAAAKAGAGGTVLVLLDADDDCAATEPNAVLSRARTILPDQRIAVVFANREYEAWFLAAATSLAGRRGLRNEINAPAAPDRIRDAKGWLAEHMVRGSYHPVADQAPLTAVFDLTAAAERSRSFRKLLKVVDEALT